MASYQLNLHFTHLLHTYYYSSIKWSKCQQWQSKSSTINLQKIL